MSDTTRRAVLAGAAGLTATAVLAACGDSSGTDTSSGGNTPAADPTTGAATTGATDGATSSSAGAASGGLAKTTDIPSGGGKIFGDKDTVITQPAAGTFKAFSATCTHQGCPVSNVSGGTINCTCHGSKYSITDGSVKNGPATKPLTAKTVTVTGDDISVA